MEFFACVLLFLAGAFVLSQGFTNPVRWARDNPGAWKGIRAVLLVALIVSVVATLQGCTAVSMQAGIDHHYDGGIASVRAGQLRQPQHIKHRFPFLPLHHERHDSLFELAAS